MAGQRSTFKFNFKLESSMLVCLRGSRLEPSTEPNVETLFLLARRKGTLGDNTMFFTQRGFVHSVRNMASAAIHTEAKLASLGYEDT